MIKIQADNTDLPRQMIKEIIQKSERKTYRQYKIILLLMLAVLSSATLIGIKPATCSNVVAYYTNISLTLFSCVVIFISYFKVTKALKQHFYEKFLSHGIKIRFLMMGMEIALISYLTLMIVPIWIFNSKAGLLQILGN